MRQLILIILFLSFLFDSNCQTFLEGFKKYRLERADTLSNRKIKKRIKEFVKSQILELDTIFKSYQVKKGFDFNTADTISLIYIAPAESPFTSDIIIWSGKDTVSYKQGFESINTLENKRIITYQPFVDNIEKQKGFNVTTERDSLIKLVSNRDFKTINRLGDNQDISDGSYISIYVAYRNNGHYKLESCFPKQFLILNSYRKQ